MLDDQIYRRLLHKSRNSNASKLSSVSAMKMLVGEFGDPIEVRRSLKRLQGDGKVEYSADVQGNPVSAFITVVRPKEEVPPHLDLWRRTLAASTISESDKGSLDCLGNALQGMDSEAMHSLLDGLIRLRADRAMLAGQLAFNVSAAYLLGSSKLIGSLDAKALKEFGIDTGAFLARPPYLVVSSPEQSSAVILVENPIAFEKAILSDAARHCTFICTFGFGLSNSANEYGNQLAGTVEAGNAILLHRGMATADSLEQLINHPNVLFWGDLDIAGIQIYERLLKKIPKLQYSGLYGPMLFALKESGRSHPYVSAVGKQGQCISAVGDPPSQALMRLCEKKGVDQEIVTLEQISKLAGSSLNII